MQTAAGVTASADAAPDLTMTNLTLSAPLIQRLEQLARRHGRGTEALGLELLEQALAQAEAEARPAGRCSTRMGQCSAGPVPLPVQQA